MLRARLGSRLWLQSICIIRNMTETSKYFMNMSPKKTRSKAREALSRVQEKEQDSVTTLSKNLNGICKVGGLWWLKTIINNLW